MTAEQIEIALSFNRVTFLPGSWNKRFAGTMEAIARNKPEYEISERGNEWLYRFVYTYRRQIPDIYDKYKDNPFCSKLKNQ
jgi:hypothetical protein